MPDGEYVQITLQLRVKIEDEVAVQSLGPLAADVDGELRVFELSAADVVAQELMNEAFRVARQTVGLGRGPSCNYTLQRPEDGQFPSFVVPACPVPEVLEG